MPVELDLVCGTGGDLDIAWLGTESKATLGKQILFSPTHSEASIRWTITSRLTLCATTTDGSTAQKSSSGSSNWVSGFVRRSKGKLQSDAWPQPRFVPMSVHAHPVYQSACQGR